MERIYSPGQIIIKEGDRDRTVYLLKSGKLGVLKGERLVAEIGKPGVPFGEMSFILHEPRSTSVKALTACVIEVYTHGIDALIADHPRIMKLVLKTLAERLSETTDRLYAHMFGQNEHEEFTLKTYVTSFKNVTTVENLVIQRVITDVSNDDLVAALLGAIPRVRDKFFKNMSKRKVEMVREDMRTALGICNRRAIESAQEKILETINELLTIRNANTKV